MKNKATLLLHSFDSLISHLNDEEAGMLLKAILDYDIRGEKTDFEDRAMLFLYSQIINSLDTHKEHYERVCNVRKKSAEKRWDSSEKSKKKDEAMQMHANAYNIKENIKEKTNKKTNENSNVNVNEEKNTDKADGFENADTQTYKKAYGDFSNIFLTDAEYELVGKMPDGEKKLQSLSAYIASTGKTYLNHYARLLNWNLYGDAEPEKNVPFCTDSPKRHKPPGERREPTFDVSEFKKKALSPVFVPPPDDD